VKFEPVAGARIRVAGRRHILRRRPSFDFAQDELFSGGGFPDSSCHPSGLILSDVEG